MGVWSRGSAEFLTLPAMPPTQRPSPGKPPAPDSRKAGVGVVRERGGMRVCRWVSAFLGPAVGQPWVGLQESQTRPCPIPPLLAPSTTSILAAPRQLRGSEGRGEAAAASWGPSGCSLRDEERAAAPASARAPGARCRSHPPVLWAIADVSRVPCRVRREG